MRVNKVYKDYFDSTKRFNVLWGGAGSGKSYAIAQKKVKRLVSSPYCKDIILRKNYVSLKDSCYSLLCDIIQDENIGADFEFKVSPLEIVYKNGNKFLFRGMQYEKDREKIKSIKDPTGAWFEEVNEFDKEDITQLNLRIRGKSQIIKQIDISFNPVDELHWLKDRFFDNPPNPDDIFTLNTTFRDNRQFLDDEYISELENLVNESQLFYKVYNKGQWGSLDVRGRIYKKYVDSLENGNLCHYDYNDSLPIIVCCDFNVDPMKWALIQNDNDKDYVFDEIVKADTDTEEVAKELFSRYGKTTYYVYGDYSGTFRHTSSRTTDYDIIKHVIPNAKIFTQPNPPVINRINAVNWRLQNDRGVRRLFVDEKCKNVRNDFNKVKYKEGTREEDKRQEDYDGKNPLQSLVHISSGIGYYIEYEYSLKGRSSGYQW